MKTNIHFSPYLAHFFLEWEMFQIKVVEKIKTYILCLMTFFLFRKLCRLWDIVGKDCRTGQATDDNIIRRIPIVSCITKAKNTHSEYVILIAFHCKNCCKNAPTYYIIVHCLSSYCDEHVSSFVTLSSGNLK